MNAYTTDPKEIRDALMHADEDAVQLIGDSCVGLAQIIVALTQQVEAMREDSRRLYAEVQALKIRLDDVEDTSETIEQAIGLAAYENGEDHL